VLSGTSIGVVRGMNWCRQGHELVLSGTSIGVVRDINQEKVTHHKYRNVTICHILVLNPKNLMQSKRTKL
jgi:hypothetical protein